MRILAYESDRQTILVPSYCFERPENALAHANVQPNDKKEEEEKIFMPFTVSDGTYQPRHALAIETDLMNQKQSSRISSAQLRSVANPMPAGAKNTCLMVEGSRTFHRSVSRGEKLPAQCYAVWGRSKDAPPLGNAIFETERCRVLVGRSAQGAIYGCFPRFDAKPEIVGWDTCLTLIKFKIRDSDPKKEDVMRLDVVIYKRQGSNPDEKPWPYELHDTPHDSELWRNLAERAYTGFKQICLGLPK